jgi:hypothetical protein
MTNEKKRKNIGCCIVYILLTICGLTFTPFMVYLGIISLYNENELNKNGIVTTAVVIDTRISNDSDVTTYEVKYQFEVNNDGITYSYSDSTGRDNLWCRISHEQWQQLDNSKELEVKYLRNNPRINRVVNSSQEPWIGDALVVVIIGFAPWIILIIVKIYEIKYVNKKMIIMK